MEIQFPGQIFVTTGRDDHGIAKDHDADAYCIACSTLDVQQILDVPKASFQIKQFQRHDRALINNQRKRVYRLDGKSVARNRRKHMDQKEPSLHDWFLEMEKQYGRPAARRLQSQLKLTKSARRYNNSDRLHPGTVFLYEGNRYTMTGQLSGGAYLRVYGEGNRNFPVSKTNVLSRNAGLVYVA